MASGIYCITHVPTGKKYVGQSWNLDGRLKQHRKQLLVGYTPLPLLRECFKGCKEEDISIKILETTDRDLDGRERFWIHKLKPELNRNVPDPDKFDVTISFACHQLLVDSLEAYRANHGLRSIGEAARQIISKATEIK